MNARASARAACPMQRCKTRRFHLAGMPAAFFLALLAAMAPAMATEFSVSPIRVELKPGALTETITVTNHAASRLRVSVKLMQWSQDAAGTDRYQESNELVYFPRQLELPPNSKRLVRVGLKNPAAGVERTYRLFIEEEPEPLPAGHPQVALYFRFGVPVFLPPAAPRTQFEVLEPSIARGKLAIPVRNSGNHHVRLEKITISDGQGYTQEVAGWYSLPGTQRTYLADIPAEVCRKATSLSIAAEGSGVQIARTLDVSPASCS